MTESETRVARLLRRLSTILGGPDSPADEETAEIVLDVVGVLGLALINLERCADALELVAKCENFRTYGPK